MHRSCEWSGTIGQNIIQRAAGSLVPIRKVTRLFAPELTLAKGVQPYSGQKPPDLDWAQWPEGLIDPIATKLPETQHNLISVEQLAPKTTQEKDLIMLIY